MPTSAAGDPRRFAAHGRLTRLCPQFKNFGNI
jgi:hypothetical protein